MKNIYVPERVEEYIEDFNTRALPDRTLREADYYRRLAGWVMDVRTPLLYEQDHDDEYRNFSINFNWLLKRDYSDTSLGAPETIETMYSLHELTHMTHRLPTRLDEVSAEEYADDFTRSEYRASNETEILIHYRVPGLRETVFADTRIAYDMLQDAGIQQPTSRELGLLRSLVIETDFLDEQFCGQDQQILQWFKQFGGNRKWAIERYQEIRQDFSGLDITQDTGLTDDQYENFIQEYELEADQRRYEQNIIRNIKFGYAMCGLVVPQIECFEQAIELAYGLEGQHARTQA